MAEDVRTTLQFQADITDFKAAMQEANRSIKLANSEFKAAASGMDDWSSSTDGLSAKLRQLSAVQQAEQRKLDVLKASYADVVKEQGENSRAAVELQTKINNQQAAVNKAAKTHDEYAAKLKEAADGTGELSDASEEAGHSLENLGKAGGAVVGVMAAVGAAVAAAVTAFLASAEATREYRREMAQLAQNASDAGHDMAQVKDTLAGVAAVTGEADGAMEGLNMLMASGLDTKNLETAADALAGAATKFDGLKFEGMAEGLQETLAVGSAVGPFAELIERTGYNLEDFNAGLAACTTEAERQQYAMQWLAESGLQEIHDAYVTTNADLVEAERAQFRLNDAMAQIGAIAEPIMTALKTLAADLLVTITPFVALIGEGLTGALNGSADAAGTFADGVVGLFNSLVDKATEVVQAIVDVVPHIITALLGALPTLIDSLLGMVSQIVTSLSAALPEIVQAIVAVVPQIITALVQNVPVLLEAATTLLMALVEAIPIIVEELVAALPQLINTITTYLSESIDVLLDAAIALLMAIVEALPTIIDALVDALPDVIEAVVDFFTENIDVLLEAAITLLMAIVDALPQVISALVKALPRITTTIISAIVKAVPKLFSTAGNLFGQLLKAAGELLYKLPAKMAEIVGALLGGLREGIAGAGRVASSIVNSIWNTFTSLPGRMLDIGKNIVSGLWNGLSGSLQWIKNKITGWVGNVMDFIKGLFGIHSPSTWAENEVGVMIGRGAANGLVKSAKYVQTATRTLRDAAAEGFAIDVNPRRPSPAAAAGGKTINYYQTINSPRALSRREIYRQTHNALSYAGGA